MNGEGGGLGGLGLSSTVLAAYAVQSGWPGDDDRRSSTTSSVGGDGFYSPAASLHGGGGSTHYGHSALEALRPLQRSHARSVPHPGYGGHHHHQAFGSHGSPGQSPPGSLAGSPTHSSKLGPGEGRGNSQGRAQAAPAEGEDAGGWQEAGGHPQPSFTSDQQYQQYQVLGDGDEPHLVQQQQPQQRRLSTESAALLAATAGKRATAPGGGRQGREASPTFHQLQHVPSFGFRTSAGRAGQQRRATAGTCAPLEPSPGAELAAAGAAAAQATGLQLAADERQRQAAAALAEEQQFEEAGCVPGAMGDACGGGKGEGAGEEGLSPEPSSSQVMTTDGDELGLDEMRKQEARDSWYRRWSFWSRALSLSLSAACFLAGILTLVLWPDVKLAQFNLWRWCFFLGCWPPIYWASVWAVWALTKFCEWRQFAARTALYFLVGTRGALMLVMRACLVLAAFAALFQTQPDLDENAAVQKVFLLLIKLLGCVVLASVGNLIKKVVIKLMATHFHKEAHFARMQEALRKEYFLSVLSQPRQHRDSMAGDSGGAGAHPFAKSFAKRWLSRHLLSKSVSALQSMPGALRSFSHRPARQPSQGDPLLVEGRQLSASLQAEKSNRSATATLTAISVVAGAGVEPSCRSMPNLKGTLQQEPSFRQLPGSCLDLPAAGGEPGGAAAAQPRSEALHGVGLGDGLAAVNDARQQHPHQPSRLSSPVSAVLEEGEGAEDAAAAAAAGARASEQAPREGPRLTRQLAWHPGRGSTAEGSGPGPLRAHHLRPSLASRQTSASTLPAARRSFAFRLPSKQPSLASAHSQSGGAPPLQQLLDLGQTREQLRARHRRTSVVQVPAARAAWLDTLLSRFFLPPFVVQMPPEELEKMHQIGKHIRKNQLKLTLVDHLKGQLDGTFTSEQEARRVAFFLYHNLRASRKRSWVQQSDLEDFLPPDQAAEAFAYLDVDGNGRISQAEVRESVAKIFQDRAHLALTLRDAKSVICKLERLLGCIIHTLFVFFYLAIFKINVTQAWLTFSSIMLAFTFIFGNSIRTVFECVVWLFVVHPYDVGDTLVLNGAENHRVEEITLLNTVLARWDGARIYCPNSRLNTDQLVNLSRSANKSETLKLTLDLSTPLEVVEMLRCTVEEHVRACPADFTGASSVSVRGLNDPMKLALGVWYEFNHNGVDAGRAGRARSTLYMVVAAALNAAHVQFTLPPFAGDPASGRAHAALDGQPELVAAMGLPRAG